MSNDLIHKPQGQMMGSPMQGGPLRTMLSEGANVGAIAIETERAIAEAQGQMTLAKRFPRSMTSAMTEFMDACASAEFAKSAFYSVPNRGSGPSIRFAEEAARCYGNFIYGHRELSRTEGKSEIEVYAWDVERNNRASRQITVMHIVDTKNGPKVLRDQADIDNKIANVASKQMRGRILALLPKHLVAVGIEACKRTIAGGSEKPISERLLAMAQAFSKFGVKDVHLVSYLGHAVDDTTIDELGELQGIYNAIREGAKPSDYFKLDEDKSDETGAAIAAASAAGAKQQAQADDAPPASTKSTARPRATASKPTESNSKSMKALEPEPGQNAAMAGQEEGGDELPPAGDESDVF